MLRPDISTEEGARRFQSSPHSYGSERTPPIPLGAESAGYSCPPGRFQPLPIYHGENDCSKHRNRFFRIPVQGRRRQTMEKKGDHMEAACRRRALSKMAKARVTSVG